MLAPLDNETIFKTAFTDKIVFTQFVKDIIGIDIEVDKIETEKKFEPKVGDIDIELDIFAESTDHRVVIEIQRIDYDYNFDRFLHYFMMAIAQLQRSAQKYKIDRTVYTIVVLTAPYKEDKETHRYIKDEVMITSLDPRNLEDKVVPIYGHKLIFLNHCHPNDDTPANYRDWLDLFNQSINNPEDFNVNTENEGVKRVVELIEFEKLDGTQMHQMKVAEQRKVVLRMERDEGEQIGEKRGMEKGKLEMAKKMKAKGMDNDTIAEISGLAKEEIEKL
ncbi:MAG: Rpn family recombination-promoting nuclease/putative transposase [bacterium]|nr:Rpn family recombination-promoting nuclease/putative transposase [bacterium]